MAVAPGYRRRSAGTYGAYTGGSPQNRDAGSQAEPGGHPVSAAPWRLVEGPGEILPDGSARLLEVANFKSVVTAGFPPVASASHEVPTRPAAGVLDGRSWATPTHPSGEIWVCLTFNVPRQASRVVLKQDSIRDLWGAPKVWRLQGSRDGSTWTDIVTQDAGETLRKQGAEAVVDFPAARYLKWRIVVDSFTGPAAELGQFDLLDVTSYDVAAGPATFETDDVSLITTELLTYCSPIRDRRPGDRMRWSASVDRGTTWVVADAAAEDFANLVPSLKGASIRFRVTLERAEANARSPVAGPVNVGLRFRDVTEVACLDVVPLLGVSSIEFVGVGADDLVSIRWDGGPPTLWRDPRWITAPADTEGVNLGEDLAGVLRVPEGSRSVLITAPPGVRLRLHR